jgi:DNA-binding PadR family transcriptional regulator
MHGYEIMQELAERTNGAWHPSPGAVYPALQSLQAQSLITGDDHAGRQAFSLTDAGREVAEQLANTGDTPWSHLVRHQDNDQDRLKQSLEQLGEAVAQLVRVGTADHKGTAADRLTELRREIYLMLAGES